MYQLLIVDDEPLVQAGIPSMLNWNEMNINICGTAMNGQAALKIIEEKSPDIVITDIKMPVMSGLELAKVCRERYGENNPYFIILTSYEDFQMARDALSYQVSDYLVKLELTPEVLKNAIDRVIILRMIQMTVDGAHKHGKWVGICGELGADTTLTTRFVQMGIDELSVAPSMVLNVRSKICEME